MQTLLDLFRKMESEYAPRIALNWLEDEDELVHSKSYADFCEDIRRCVSYLRQELESLDGSTHIALLARSSYDYVVMDFAILLSGAVSVPLNYEKSPEELRYELSHADVAVLVHDGNYEEREGSLSTIFTGRLLGIGDYHPCAPADALPDALDPNALAMILYTSGTTGRSKGVMHSHASIMSAALNNVGANLPVRALLGKKPGETVSELSVAPFYHVCSHDRIFGHMVQGDPINVCTDSLLFSRAMVEMDSQYLLAFPVIYELLCRYVRSGKTERLGALRVLASCGAPINPDIMSHLADRHFGFANGYGLTETFGSGCQNYSFDISRIESIGPVQPHMEHRILESGELLLRGGSLMMGYYNDPQSTAEVIDGDGWFHTGDLVRQDEEGYLYITGRCKNLIILSSGENINPEELEALLIRCEDIEEALVKEKDKKLCAVIFCQEDRQDAVRGFITAMNRNLPRYKQVNLVEFSPNPLPRTSNGKLRRS